MFYTHKLQLSQLSLYQHTDVRRGARKVHRMHKTTAGYQAETGKYRKKLLDCICSRGNSFSEVTYTQIMKGEK